MSKLKPHSDYFLLEPEEPKGGAFKVVEGTNIKEIGRIVAVGPYVKATELVGKKVVFNAWACDEKNIDGKRYYFVSESANAICATL